MIAQEPILEAEIVGRRRCAARRIAAPREGMVRFVVAPGGTIVPDLQERLPGRGVWIGAQRKLIEAPTTRHAFARAAQGRVEAPSGLADLVEQGLAARCIDLVGLAKRAGQLIIGFDQVEAALKAEPVALLLIARDAATGAGRLTRLAGDIPLVACLTREELGGAVGRAELVYAAVAPGGIADKLGREAARLQGMRIDAAAEVGYVGHGATGGSENR